MSLVPNYVLLTSLRTGYVWLPLTVMEAFDMSTITIPILEMPKPRHRSNLPVTVSGGPNMPTQMV